MTKIRILTTALTISLLLTASFPFTVLAQSNATTTGTLELAATFRSISVYASFTGDENENNYVPTLEYREAGGTWKQGVQMAPDRMQNLWTGASNRLYNQWRASILLLSPDTEYEVKVTFSDTDNVDGTNPLIENHKHLFRRYPYRYG